MGQVLVQEAFKELMSPELPLDDRLIITPLLSAEKQIGQGSIDLRLGSEFLESSRRDLKYIDPFQVGTNVSLRRNTDETRTYVPLGRELTLHPGQFVLGATLEFLSIPANIVGQVVSRSSWGRLGLLVATAVAVQPGFRGVLTLELVNTGAVPIVLRPGLRVAQLQLWTADRAVNNPYGGQTPNSGKYPNPLGPESQKLAWEAGESKKLLGISAVMHADSAMETKEVAAVIESIDEG